MERAENKLKHRLVNQLLEQQAECMPDKTAVIQNNTKYTYAFLEKLSNRFANWLLLSKVKPGDRVLIFGENSFELICAIFGTLKAGAVFIPMHPETPSGKLEYILTDCLPSAILIDPHLRDKHACLKRIKHKPVLITSGTINEKKDPGLFSWETLQSFDDKPPPVTSTTDDLAAVIYTSGSTGLPKGVMELHRNIVFAVSAINSILKNNSEDIILNGLPFSFDYGLYQIFLAFQAGAALVVERDFSVPIAIPRLIKMHKVTGFPGVPSIFAMLLRSRLLERIKLPDLRYITSTGDVFPKAYILELQKLFPGVDIFPMYGLTECKRVSIMPMGKLKGHESTVGLPLPGTHVFIINRNGSQVSDGETGELVVSGPHVMAGYWNDPEETALRFRKNVNTGDIELYTGDIFRRKEDGYLYFVGRDETFIKKHGQKISLVEIENIITEFDGIAEVAAVGVSEPEYGESVCVFVSRYESSNLTAKDISEQCRHFLTSIEIPKNIIILDKSIPRNSNGKIDRARLRLIATEKIAEDEINYA